METSLPLRTPAHLDGLVETRNIETAQAVANLRRVKRFARLLRQLRRATA